MYEKKQLFDFMQQRVGEVGKQLGLKPHHAFGQWFSQMYFGQPLGMNLTDGGGDGKVDLFFRVARGSELETIVINSKYTTRYDNSAPVAFYDEITRFWQAFQNTVARKKYLQTVRPELRSAYVRLFDAYDSGRGKLIFLTNHKRNEKQYNSVSEYDVEIFHVDEIVQFMADHIEDAMPKTQPLLLTGINAVLSPDKSDTAVPTSIVFARLIDFSTYMKDDPFGLLFARNVRISLGSTPVNSEIRETFDKCPEEFAFSNNGITLLCEKHRHDPGTKELTIENPRVVNGAQTLHSIRDVSRPSKTARVMLRIIEIPPPSTSDLASQIQRRKEVINKISIRSNRQNPIKRWNLVANDDFQHELARFFRKRDFYYERREQEWKYRRAALRAAGVKKGPGIKKLAQLLASFLSDEKQLGPAIAKSSVGDLFEDKPYHKIRRIDPEIAYQLFLISKVVAVAVDELARERKYVANLQGHMDLCLFALACKSLNATKFDWGAPSVSRFLERELENPARVWRLTVALVIASIRKRYSSVERAYRKQKKELTFNNFFKSQKLVQETIRFASSRAVRRKALEISRASVA